jgi:DNA-binding IclR family transcriptional regulator
VAAAVSVSGPSFRLTGKRATRLIDEMLGAADAISRELGGV